MNRWTWPIIGCVASTLALGSRYWTVSYHDLELPTSLPVWALLVTVVITVALRVASDAPAWLVFLTGALPIPIVVCVRIAVDVTLDPTSHNLFPFEVVIAVFVGSFLGAVGLGIGQLLRMTRRSAPQVGH